MEMARSMMAHAGLPDKYWAEAVDAVAYIRNCTSTLTPLQVWSGEKPNIGHLKVFGCTAFAHIPDTQRQKLDKKAVKLRFVGYSIQSKGYRLLDEKTSQVYIHRDVVFNEEDFGHEVRQNPCKEQSEVEIESFTEQSQQTQPQELRLTTTSCQVWNR